TYEKLEKGIFLLRSNSSFGPICNGILVKNVENSKNILIDCNFTLDEILNLNDSLDDGIHIHYSSHTHLDHVSNLHFYENLGVRIYCPIPEDRYLKDMNIFMEENGMTEYGIDDIFLKEIYQRLKFKNLLHVEGFKPGITFSYGNFNIETFHIPGHSPGHTAFLIRDKTLKKRDILFVSDIGIEKSGPWYGLKHCSLMDYRKSIKKLEEVYMNDNFILISSHGNSFSKKQPQIFKNALKRIEINEGRVLDMFDSKVPKSIDEITFKGVYYSENHLKRLPSDFKKIHYFWEWYLILHHINELVEKEKLKKVDQENRFILN
ncbi:MAG: MBL fold metallo-hydrolase, partial [Promethearchaeota archaeon]